MRSILFLEDDMVLNKGICMALEREGYEMTGCTTIAEAKLNIQKRKFDMLILDANLPDGNGFQLCRDIRGSGNIPIILLTARTMECDMVDGLESGADDYIVKPVSIRVLCAHIQALFRRTLIEDSKLFYCSETFSFDFSKMQFRKNGLFLELSKTEQKLLYYLIVNANSVVKREKILDYVWTNELIYVEDNTLAVTIKRLREKLEDDSARPKHIITVYGLGYKWEDDIC